MINWILSILPNGSKILLNISSVILKCKEPTYNLIGPVMPLGIMLGIELPILFFSACVCWTMIGTPSNFCPDNPNAYKTNHHHQTFQKLHVPSLTKATLSGSLNSMYAIPLNLLVLLQTINRTSLTLPTELKNSSKSLARILCDNCITKTVLASLSSGLSSSTGEFERSPIGDRPRLPNFPTGDRERLREGERCGGCGCCCCLRSLLRVRRRLLLSFLSFDRLRLSLSRERDFLSRDFDLRSRDLDLRRSFERILSRLRLLRRSLSRLRRLSRDRRRLRRFRLLLRRFLLEWEGGEF